MKIYKDDYKRFRICQKILWFLNINNYSLAKKLIDEKKILNFIELTNNKTSSKFEYDFNFNESKNNIKEYIGEKIADGIETGYYAQKYFKNKYSCFNFEFTNNTKTIEIINNIKYDVFFEPRFEYQNCIVKCDVLKRNISGWDLIEVKAITWIKKEHMWDLLYQYDILTKCGIKINNIYIMYLNKNYINKLKIDLNKLFIINGSNWKKNNNSKIDYNIFDSIKKEILNNNLKLQYKQIENIIQINNMKQILKLLTFPYCHNKIKKFCPHIFKYFPIKNTIFELYRLTKLKKALWYYKEKFLKINDKRLLPFLKNSNFHLRQYNVIKNKKTIIDKNKFWDLKTEYKKYQYPIYMYDFETMKSAIPKFKNIKPYQQIPFQYSVHVLLKSDFNFRTYKSIKHYEFLSDGNEDPRKFFLKNICYDFIKIHGKGTYVAYNQSFEKKIIEDLINYYPKYKKKLLIIYNNTIDLQNFFKEFKIYKNEFHGSLSIKKLVPAFEPSFSYESLIIKKGDVASEIFRRKIENNINSIDWINYFREHMLKYCFQDTLGMVILFWHLKKIIKSYKFKNGD